ncbi:MAG: hypothetical protein JKY95_07710 [Planctomycetaceae bacterium]|nr:hypothetical protein [Planctomycetaceae bacterium]
MARRYIIGMDEAGYGPKLGPLLIAATVWSVPEDCSSFDFWSELETVATNTPARSEHRLHVADSKKVYSSSKGLKSLERSVFGFASLAGYEVESLRRFIEQLAGTIPETFETQSWYQNRDLQLPLACNADQIAVDAGRLEQAMQTHSLRLEKIAVDVICPQRFNHLVEKLGNKSELLTRCSLDLIQRVRPPLGSQTMIFADKHGGRNRYLEYLNETFSGETFFSEQESQTQSTYRSEATTITFGVKSERHFPVAIASMVAKYIREICMDLFNRFWLEQLPELKPTKGYPQDAARFRSEVEHLLPRLAIEENVFWRNR